MSSYLYPKSYLQLTTTTRKGETHFSREVLLVIQTTKQKAPCPTVDGQYKTNSRVLLENFILALVVFCLYILASNFEFLWILCVCAYICVSCALSQFLFFISSCLFACSFCFILVCLTFLREKESIELERQRDREDLGGDKGGETVIRIQCMKKNFIFNKNSKKKKVTLQFLETETFAGFHSQS